MRKPKGGISGYDPLAIDNLADPIWGDIDLSRQLRRGNAECSKLIGKDLAGMDRVTWHLGNPSPSRRQSMQNHDA